MSLAINQTAAVLDVQVSGRAAETSLLCVDHSAMCVSYITP